MKSKLFFLLVLTVLTTVAQAQIIHEPNSEIYKDINIWLVQGYIKSFLPLTQPYPLPLINQILDEVMESEDEKAIQRALYHKKRLDPGVIYTHPGATVSFQGKNDENEIMGSIFTEGLFSITKMLNLSYHFAFYGMTDAGMEGLNIPGKYTPLSDIMFDNSNIGSVKLDQNWTSLLSFGTENAYLQAGLARTSFGPFYDNGVVVGPQSPRAGHFSFIYWRPKWSFEMLFQVISASDDFGLGYFPNKYNVIHTINIRPKENLELGFIQSVIYGNRLEFMYIVPFSYLFGSQSIFGFDDNIIMGLYGQWRPLDTFLVKAIAYVDDFHLNDLISLKGVRAKAAGQIGLSWAPKNSIFSKLDFDYTAVLPYMYSHFNTKDEDRYNRYDGSNLEDPRNPGYQKRTPNFHNYTHFGRNIGPDLEPNSDRISLMANMNIIPSIELNISGYFTRHGNASMSSIYSGVMDEYIHDGSIFDDQQTDPWKTEGTRPRLTRYGFDLWLTQDVLDIRIGGVIGIAWTLPIPPKFGTFKLSADYCAEYGWNRTIKYSGPVQNNNGLDHYWSFGASWNF